jgi:hypothetical protein
VARIATPVVGLLLVLSSVLVGWPPLAFGAGVGLYLLVARGMKLLGRSPWVRRRASINMFWITSGTLFLGIVLNNEFVTYMGASAAVCNFVLGFVLGPPYPAFLVPRNVEPRSTPPEHK